MTVPQNPPDDQFADGYRYPVVQPAGEYQGQLAAQEFQPRDTRKPPQTFDYELYRQLAVGPTRNQKGRECTGFSLAAAADYLIRRKELEKQLTAELIERAFETGFAKEKSARHFLDGVVWSKSGRIATRKDHVADADWQTLLTAVSAMLLAESTEPVAAPEITTAPPPMTDTKQLTAKLISRAFDTGFAAGEAQYFLDGMADTGQVAESDWLSLLGAVNNMLSAEATEEVAETKTLGDVTRTLARRAPAVSPRMMYEMAQEFDGAAARTGSTLRGALIGWERRGVAAEEFWPYDPDDEEGEIYGRLTLARINDARTRRLAARYTGIPKGQRPKKGEAGDQWTDFDIEEMKRALVEGHVLYLAAEVHTGWYRPYEADDADDEQNVTEIDPEGEPKGQHAFLVVGYNEVGFWVHNSWGPNWGAAGYAVLTYGDWKRNGVEVWVPEVEAPQRPLAQAAANTIAAQERTATAATMWRHVVALDDNGQLCSDGLRLPDEQDEPALYQTDAATLGTRFHLFKRQTAKWEQEAQDKGQPFTPRLLIFADDGSKPWPETIKDLVPLRDRLMEAKIYPLFLVWDVPWYPDLNDELSDEKLFVMPTNETRGELSKDMEEIMGDWLLHDTGTATDPHLIDLTYYMFEYGAATTHAVEMWRALRRRAQRATEAKTTTRKEGGLRTLVGKIEHRWNDKPFDLHLAGHGVGAYTLEALAPLLPVPVTNCELWAPASRMRDFDRTLGRGLAYGGLQQMTVTVLDDAAETSDSIGWYNESVLCLASNVLAVDNVDSAKRFYYGPLSEAPPDDPLSEAFASKVQMSNLNPRPEPLLGLHRFIARRLRPSDRVKVEVVPTKAKDRKHNEHETTCLTHAGLASCEDVHRATIDRIQAITDTGRPVRQPSGDPLAMAEAQWRARNSGDPLVRAQQRQRGRAR